MKLGKMAFGLATFLVVTSVMSYLVYSTLPVSYTHLTLPTILLV